MKKFYMNEREVETLEELLGHFIKEILDYTEYITELTDLKLDIISEELSDMIEIIRDGGERGFNKTIYRVE